MEDYCPKRALVSLLHALALLQAAAPRSKPTRAQQTPDFQEPGGGLSAPPASRTRWILQNKHMCMIYMQRISTPHCTVDAKPVQCCLRALLDVMFFGGKRSPLPKKALPGSFCGSPSSTAACCSPRPARDRTCPVGPDSPQCIQRLFGEARVVWRQPKSAKAGHRLPALAATRLPQHGQCSARQRLPQNHFPPEGHSGAFLAAFAAWSRAFQPLGTAMGLRDRSCLQTGPRESGTQPLGSPRPPPPPAPKPSQQEQPSPEPPLPARSRHDWTRLRASVNRQESRARTVAKGSILPSPARLCLEKSYVPKPP